MRITILAATLGVLSVLAVSTVWAQQGGGFDASFNAFDSGGGTSTGAGFVVQAGIGQPVAGTSSDGTYSLDAGVIPGSAGQTGATPTTSPTAVPSVGPYKMFGPQVAKDGVN